MQAGGRGQNSTCNTKQGFLVRSGCDSGRMAVAGAMENYLMYIWPWLNVLKKKKDLETASEK